MKLQNISDGALIVKNQAAFSGLLILLFVSLRLHFDNGYIERTGWNRKENRRKGA